MSKTVFVAVHGIGDQVKFSTAQAVAKRVYTHYRDADEDKFGMSLGGFHSALESGKREEHIIGEPFEPEVLQDTPLGPIGFTEVYWADVARHRVDGYTLQGARKWADMLAARIYLHAQRENGEIDYELTRQVLKEMSETLGVTDRVLALAAKANIGHGFELKKILDDYLGDVQFVAEYASVRDEILERFSAAMQAAGGFDPDRKIVIVAHSEGTVVSLLGILTAASRRDRKGNPDPPSWLAKVSMLVTLGSPIDKHYHLWPDLWPGFEHAQGIPGHKIVWWNYYDKGDPVGFELDSARKWLRGHGLLDGDQPLFEFTEEHDIGYSRSAVPGKAHVDYWEDEDLFGHFLGRLEGKRPDPPANSLVALFLCYCLPYGLVFGLMFAAVLLLGKGAQDGGIRAEGVRLFAAAGFTCLIFGTTIWARINRLTLRSKWTGFAFGGFLVGCFFYLYWVPQSLKLRIPGLDALFGDAFGSWGPIDLCVVAAAVALAGTMINRRKPHWGIRPMVVIGGVAALVMLFYTSSLAQQSPVPPTRDVKWLPLLFGAGLFLYIWWLATLLFDLFFVWHRYIRHAVGYGKS